ncbi:MAG: short-chain dehydrogenase/reductase [Aeromicrobium sp.]|nr:short-chain dehydrogenase/reductase [Aeromicrobium sp.]
MRKTIIVTGGNSGVGEATAQALAAQGHRVVIACRDVSKGERAASRMDGEVDVRRLDLADLESVRSFADTVDQVDVLVNNAGVLGLPLTRTVDGFEMHMGTNHLGHFALTCLLGDRVRDRVVVVASTNHAMARLHLDDLSWERRPYKMWSAYGESKLANVLFAHELLRRGMTVYVSDPGMTNTGITTDRGGALGWSGTHLQPRIAQSPAKGARSTIMAVSTTDVPPGTYLAPRGVAHQWGRPKPVTLRPHARDAAVAAELWTVSAELTGCDLP